MSDLDLLRRLGDDLVPPPLDLLRETARSRDRRTAAAAALVAAAAVAGIAAGALLLAPDEAGREPQPTETPTQIAPTSRPLTYADGATIHYGDRTVDAGGSGGRAGPDRLGRRLPDRRRPDLVHRRLVRRRARRAR